MRKLTFSERALLSEREKKFDPKATAEDCIEDLRKIQEKFPLKHITRNFYRANGKYSDSTWNQYYGSFLEFRRQAKLELSRGQHALERQIAKHASADVYRQFYKEEVLPYHQKHAWTDKQKKRFKTVVVASDFHDIECDMFALGIFIDVIKDIQPDVVCLNGDIHDSFVFSKYANDPRQFRIKERFDFVKHKIFSQIRKAAPKAQCDFILGNHDYYVLRTIAEKTPAMRIILSDVMGIYLKDIFGLDEYGINLVAKLDLAAFTETDANEEMKQNYQVYYDAFVAHHYEDFSFGLSGTNGHTHRPKQTSFRNYPMGRLLWTNTGAMRQTDADYVTGLSHWLNSFLIAHIDTHTKQVTHDHVIIQDGFCVVNGKLYVRKTD